MGPNWTEVGRYLQKLPKKSDILYERSLLDWRNLPDLQEYFTISEIISNLMADKYCVETCT